MKDSPAVVLRKRIIQIQGYLRIAATFVWKYRVIVINQLISIHYSSRITLRVANGTFNLILTHTCF